MARWSVAQSRGIGARGHCAPSPTGSPASPASRPPPVLRARSITLDLALPGLATVPECNGRIWSNSQVEASSALQYASPSLQAAADSELKKNRTGRPKRCQERMNPCGPLGRVVQCHDPDVSRTELIGATPTRLEFKPLIELRERESRLRRPGTQATRILMAYELGLTSFRA
jgi:hypothetical protein